MTTVLGWEIMTRKRKYNSQSKRYVAAAEQVCLQPVLEHRQRRGRRNIASCRYKRVVHWVGVVDVGLSYVAQMPFQRTSALEPRAYSKKFFEVHNFRSSCMM